MFAGKVTFQIMCVALLATYVQAQQGHDLGHEVPHSGSSYASFIQQSYGGSDGHHAEPHAHPKYQFKYGVEDHHTGDFKEQQESRDGDKVTGSYSVHEPDGTILTVDYTADKHSGFNAVVHREGHATHPEHYSHH